MSITDPDSWWEDFDRKGVKYDKILELISFLNTTLNFFNGTFRENFDALVTSDGATVTMSLEKTGTGNLTMQFSDGKTVLDCTPALTIVLTAGSDQSAQMNHIYILKSTKVLTNDLEGFPSAEHIPIGHFNVPSAGFVQTNGCYINQNINNRLQNITTLQGYLSDLTDKIRLHGADYISGIDGNGSDGYLTPTASNVELITTVGQVFQMHPHTFPVISTVAGDVVLVKNWFGDAFHDITNLFDITADSTGATIGNNKFFNLILWGVANKTNEYHIAMLNLPAGFYNTEKDARADLEKYTDTGIPSDYTIDTSTGFLIAKIMVQMGATWTVVETVDLRGDTPRTALGGGGTGAHNHVEADVTDLHALTKAAVDALGITTVGTINSGTWQGTPLTDSYVSDTISIGGMSSAEIVDALMFGSGNSAFVPCILVPMLSSLRWEHNTNHYLQGATGVDYFHAILPLPTVKRGLSLFVKNVRFRLTDADGSNKITNLWIFGHDATGRPILKSSTIGWSTIALHTVTLTEQDCSGYESIEVGIAGTTNNIASLDLQGLEIECWYE